MKTKLISVSVGVLLIITSLCPCMLCASAATTKTSADAMSWVASKEHTKVGSGQCVALIAAYYNYLGFSSVSGDGCDYATNTIPDGLGWREKEAYRKREIF